MDARVVRSIQVPRHMLSTWDTEEFEFSRQSTPTITRATGKKSVGIVALPSGFSVIRREWREM